MGRPKGLPKTGGRKRGVPNRNSSNLVKFFESVNFDVPSEIYNLLPSLEPNKQADILMKLMEYIHPKRRPAEITGGIDDSRMSYVDFIELASATIEEEAKNHLL